MLFSLARHGRSTRLAALALLALGLLQPVRAQEMTESVFVAPAVGLAPGQSVRFTLFVPDGTPVRARVKLHNERGAVLAISNEATIPAGEFHSFDFHRRDIRLSGEEGTGRIQVQASISSVRQTSSEASDPVVASMEIIDGPGNTIPGTTQTQGFIITFDRPIDPLMNETIIGIIPGQTLRASLLNPNPRGSGPAVNGHVKIFDGSGNLISQSADLIIPSGEFRSFDFDPAALSLPGEPGTGRLQVRAVVRGSFDLTFTGQTASAPLSLEVIDNPTGRTSVFVCRDWVFGVESPN